MRPDGPRFHFFTGAGGAGKSTCAAAAAIAHAASLRKTGARVLVMSVEAGDGLSDVLGRRLGPEPTPVSREGSGALVFAMRHSGARALERFILRHEQAMSELVQGSTAVAPDRLAALLDCSLPALEAVMSLAEVANVGRPTEFDAVYVDLPPTSGTIRLLRAPAAAARWSDVLDALVEQRRFVLSRERYPVAEPSSRLVDELQRAVRRADSLLRDADDAGFSVVTRAEPESVEEAEALVRVLDDEEVPVERIIVNRVEVGRPCASCAPRAGRATAALEDARRRFGAARLRVVHAAHEEPRHVAKLRQLGVGVLERFGALLAGPAFTAPPAAVEAHVEPAEHDAAAALALVPTGAEVVAVVGKAGSGASSIAAALAVTLARANRGRCPVALVSARGARGLARRVGVSPGGQPTTVRIEPNLSSIEVDGDAALEGLRARHADAVRKALGAGAADSAVDEPVLSALADLLPSACGHALALAELVGRGGAELPLLVVDGPAAAGLEAWLEAPRLAAAWLTAFANVLESGRAASHPALAELVAEVRELERRVTTLRAVLHDEERTAIVAVSEARTVSTREVERVLETVTGAGMRVGGVVLTRARCASGEVDECERCATARVEEPAAARQLEQAAVQAQNAASGGSVPHAQVAVAFTPERAAASLVGTDALAAFAAAWRGTPEGAETPRTSPRSTRRGSRPRRRRRASAPRTGTLSSPSALRTAPE